MHNNHLIEHYTTLAVNTTKQFSPTNISNNLKENAFPVIKRESAVDCDASSWLQKGSKCPVIICGEDNETIKNRTALTAERVNELKTAQGILNLNIAGIELALDRRVALFFQQAILCYRMPAFTFSARGADSQIGSAPALTFMQPKGPRTSHKREAAHSSTIPTLIAHAKDGSTPNGIVYFKGGSSHDQHNATIGMHECVNGADELIDGIGTDNKLRAVAVGILNRVADGLKPQDATLEFMRAFTEQTNRVINELRRQEVREGEASDKRRLVCEIYQQKMQALRQTFNNTIFDYLIGVNIDPNDPQAAVLRDTCYKKRMDIIRLQEVIENRVGKRIADLKNSLEGQRASSYIEHIIIKAFAETAERTVLAKLFAKTPAVFEEGYTVNAEKKEKERDLKAFRTKVQNLYDKNKTKIDNLLRNLRSDFHELRSAELTFSSGVFRDFRVKVKKWTQVQFTDKYYQRTGHRVSKSWVSRTEQLERVPTKLNYETPLNQRRKYVTIDDAVRIANTFDVDAGIFLPCLFTS